MASNERLRTKEGDQEKLILIDPSELMRDNPAALIVNKESYNRIEAYFSPDQFETPQVVRVRTYSSAHGEVERLFVVDGLTRTKFANDHKGKRRNEAPDFSFDQIMVKDVTSSLLKNPEVVVEGEYGSSGALTMLQYLRAVIPPTIEHSEIAPDRIAAHLINGWEKMVGEDLAEKFSALAALNLLANPRVPIFTDEALKKFFIEQDKIMAKEKTEERLRLIWALRETASVVRQAKLNKAQIVHSAFILVIGGSAVIGGEREKVRQVFGLLNTWEVERKLTEKFPHIGEREEKRVELGELVLRTLKRQTDTKDQKTTSVLSMVLEDKSLQYEEVLGILKSDFPAEEYDQTKKDINERRLCEYYTAEFSHKTDLSEDEKTMLSQLGGKTYLDQRELMTSSRAIKSAGEELHSAENYVKELELNFNSLIEQGVNPKVIEEMLLAIKDRRRLILIANSSLAVGKKREDLKSMVDEAKRKISFQLNYYKTKRIVDEFYGPKLEEGYGPEIIEDKIARYVLAEIKPFSEIAAKERVNQLSKLDEDLQTSVISGQMRINHAVSLQRERATESKQSAAEVVLPRPETASRIIYPLEPVEEEPSEREARRIEENNKRLISAISSLENVLALIDLSPNEIAPKVTAEIDRALVKMGKLRFNHPDIVRIIQGYLRELELKKAKSESSVQQAIKDTAELTKDR